MSTTTTSDNKHMKPSEQQDQDDSSLLLLQQYPILASSSLSPSLAALFSEQIVPALAEPGGAAEQALPLLGKTPPFLPAILLEHNPDLFCHMVPFLRVAVALRVLGRVNHAFRAAVDEGITSLMSCKTRSRRVFDRGAPPTPPALPQLTGRFPFLTELSVSNQWQRRLLLQNGLPQRLTMLKFCSSFQVSDVLFNQPWPCLERLSLHSMTDLEGLIPQSMTDNDHEPHTAPPALLFPALQVLTFSKDDSRSGMHFLAQALRRGAFPHLRFIEVEVWRQPNEKRLLVQMAGDEDVADLVTILQHLPDTLKIDARIKRSFPTKSMTPLYHSIKNDCLFAQLRCLILSEKYEVPPVQGQHHPSYTLMTYKHTVSVLNSICVRGVVPCLEELSVRAPLEVRADDADNTPANPAVTATLMLEEGSLPQLTRLHIDGDTHSSRHAAGSAFLALVKQLLYACGGRLEQLICSDGTSIEVPSFKGLVVLLSELVSSAPWRGTLKQLLLPSEVGPAGSTTKTSDTIGLLGQDQELLASTYFLLSQLPCLHTLQLAPPGMSTILGLLQAKEGGSLPDLSVVNLVSLDTTDAGNPALLLLFQWIHAKHEQGEKLFRLSYEDIEEYDIDQHSRYDYLERDNGDKRLVDKVENKRFPWFNLSRREREKHKLSSPANSNQPIEVQEQQDQHNNNPLLLQQYPILTAAALSPQLVSLFTNQIAPALAEPGGAAEQALPLFGKTPLFLPALLLEQNPDLFRCMLPYLHSTVALLVLGRVSHAFRTAVDDNLTSLCLCFVSCETEGKMPPLLAGRFSLLTELSVTTFDECHCYSDFPCRLGATLYWQRQLLLQDGLSTRLTTLELGGCGVRWTILCSQAWPRLERLSLPSLDLLQRMVPQNTSNDQTAQASQASLFPVLQVLTLPSDQLDSGKHSLALAIRKGAFPRLCTIESSCTLFSSPAANSRLPITLASDVDVADLVVISRYFGPKTTVIATIAHSLSMESMTPFYHHVRHGYGLARIRCLELSITGIYKHTVPFLNALCHKGAAACLEELYIGEPMNSAADDETLQSDATTATALLMLEEMSLPHLTLLKINGSRSSTWKDGPALLTLVRQLLQACGDKLRKLDLWHVKIDAPSFKALVILLSEMVSSVPWRGDLVDLDLPYHVGQDTGSAIELLGQDEELMISTRVLLTGLPSLRRLMFGPPCLSTVLGLLQAKEAGALPFLSRLYLFTRDSSEAGNPALLLLSVWMNGKHKQGQKVFALQLRDHTKPGANTRLIGKLNDKKFPWLQIDRYWLRE